MESKFSTFRKLSETDSSMKQLFLSKNRALFNYLCRNQVDFLSYDSEDHGTISFLDIQNHLDILS